MIAAFHFTFDHRGNDPADYSVYGKSFSLLLKNKCNVYTRVSVGYLLIDTISKSEWDDFVRNLWETKEWLPCFIADPANELKRESVYVLLFHDLGSRVVSWLHKTLAKNAGGYLGALVVNQQHFVQNRIYLKMLDPRFLIVGSVIYILHYFEFVIDKQLHTSLLKSGFSSVTDALIIPGVDDLRFLLS